MIRARLVAVSRSLSRRALDTPRARTYVIVAAVVFALLLPFVASAATSSTRSPADNFAGKPSAKSGYSTAAIPNPPTAVFAKAPTGNATFVNWSPPTTALVGAVSYEVWRADSEGAASRNEYTFRGTTTGGVYATSYVDTTTVSTKRYWYAVKTVDDGIPSAPSDVSEAVWPSIAPTTGPPARPGAVRASTTGGTIKIEWGASSDAAGYYVLRGRSSLSSSLTTMTPFLLAGTSYLDVTASAGEPYYYTVVAVDASGTLSPLSVEAEGRAVDAVASGQPEPHKTGTSESACLCHASHTAAGPIKLTKFPGDSSSAICGLCHTPATALGEFLDPLALSRHSLSTTTSVENPFTCMTCHVPVYNAGDLTASLLRVNGSWVCTTVTGATPGNGFCYTCHGTGSTLPEGDLRVFEGSAHSTITAPATGAKVVCDACHESHSSRNESLLKYSGYMVCMQCHTSAVPDPNAPDLLSRLQLNPDANAKHPILLADQVDGAKMTCQNCHNTHASTVATPLVDPHDPSPAGAWTGDEKAFCFRCHDGLALPTSTETTPWADPVLARGAETTVTNILLAYDRNLHGFGVRSDTTTITANLRPDMGYTANTTLECRSCHDPHGTMNNYALQQNVVSASGDKTVSGLVVAKVPGGGYDLRFFCASCHLWDPVVHRQLALEDTTTIDFAQFPIDCTQCHRHMDPTFPTPRGSLDL